MELQLPKEWPVEAGKLYKPIKPLGKGGFTMIYLAAPLETNDNLGKNETVVIKLMGHANSAPISKFEKRSEFGYFCFSPFPQHNEDKLQAQEATAMVTFVTPIELEYP